MKKYQNLNQNKTLNQTKNLILKDARKLFRQNMDAIKALDFKINDHSYIGKDMLDDFLNEIIYNKYLPISYDDLIEWTKQEPVLINKLIPPSFYKEDESILNLITGNIVNYLKTWFYSKLNDLINELK